jgi:hypothetical protein
MPFLNLTPSIGSSNQILVNVSYMLANQSPFMTTHTVWLVFILTGISLMLLSAVWRERLVFNDLSGAMASGFLLLSALQSFSVDVVTGSRFVTGTDVPVMGVIVETHTIYHYELWGVLLAVLFVISLANLYRIWLDHKRVAAELQAEEARERMRPTSDETRPSGQRVPQRAGGQQNRVDKNLFE